MFQTYEVEEEGREKNALDPKPEGFLDFQGFVKESYYLDYSCPNPIQGQDYAKPE